MVGAMVHVKYPNVDVTEAAAVPAVTSPIIVPEASPLYRSTATKEVLYVDLPPIVTFVIV